LCDRLVLLSRLTASSLVERARTIHCVIDVAVGVADGEEAVVYDPTDGDIDADPVDIEEGVEALELAFAKLTTGGPGNVYSMGGL